MNFHQFKTAIQKQFKHMENKPLFRVKVDKDLLWNTYLNSFPAGTNEIFRERRSADCSCCRHFIRDVGDIVTIENGVITSIWDVSNKLNDGYQVVAKALSEYIHSQTIENKFLHFQAKVGIDKNYQQLPDGKTLTFEHFQLTLPSHATAKNKDIPTLLNDSNTTCGVFERSLQQISLEAINTVQELIAQNSLYRGQEATFAINSFKTLKVAYDKLETAQSKNLFIWEKFSTVPAAVAKIKNTAIGTLLEDLSLLVRYANEISKEKSESLLYDIFKTIPALNPTKSAVDYWLAVNKTILGHSKSIFELWQDEKIAATESIEIAKIEALKYLSSEREKIMRMTHAEALKALVKASKIDSKIRIINSISDNGLFGIK